MEDEKILQEEQTMVQDNVVVEEAAKETAKETAIITEAEVKKWRTISFVMLLLGAIFGVIAIIFSGNMKKLYYDGDLEEALKVKNNIKTCLIVAIVVNVMAVLFYMI